ncbi:extracellular matrix protein 2 isoform X3 [Hyla sarda]|uniref:extracellular matrix protein 2 isoform X3 n=1 Tax=Hyla sarda TaxID=327740 RepID=UPI0024C296F4|nr:extracellular matrix protein 2 isoform X3 [Hyla sarda]
MVLFSFCNWRQRQNLTRFPGHNFFIAVSLNCEKKMRAYILVCIILMIFLYIGWAQDDPSTPKHQKRRIQQRRRRVPLRNLNGRQKLIKPSPIPVPSSDAPLYNGDDIIVHILQAVLGVSEPAPSYNILPAKKGHCMVNGITMYDKAVWSPKPCVTCMCSNGNKICDETVCPLLTCPKTEIPNGECCPVCSQTEPTEPNNGVLMKLPHTQEEMDELLRKEEEMDELLRKEEENRVEKKPKAGTPNKKKKKEKKRLQKHNRRKTVSDDEAEHIQEEKRKAYEEEEMRIEAEERRKLEEEERKKKEEERRKKEEEDRREEEVNRLAMERKQRERNELDLEDDDDEDDEDDDEDYNLRGDVFRVLRRRIPGSRRPTEIHHPPLPPGCFISEITVSCSNAKMTRIPPISDPDVKSLDLLGNFIASIPKEAFNGMPNLERIDLSKNKLMSTGIDPLAFKSLKNLRRLYLDGNLLDQIPLELPSTLEELKLNENKLSSLEEDSLKDLKNLVTLELEGNQLSEANVSPLAFKPLQHMSYLRMGRNKFRTIPQGLPASIEELHLENNQIEEISETVFNHTVNLNMVVLRYNQLEETRIPPLTWIYHKNLESIDLSYNKLYQVPSYLPKSLLHLVLVGNQIERIPGYVFAHLNSGLEYLYLSFNKLDNDGIDPTSFHGAYHSLREIFLDYNELTSVPVGMEDMRDLHILRLNNNKIKVVSPNCICSAEDEWDSNLEYLHLENNYINTREISPYAFSCIRSYSSVILKPQKVK